MTFYWKYDSLKKGVQNVLFNIVNNGIQFNLSNLSEF